jgi:tRNA pseudouridine55 synthase
MDGLLVVDKPSGPTSHDVVARLRRVLGERRVGHTGTLDPLATGVLPLVVGRATRLARFLSASDKSYEAVIRLGMSTDTADAVGAPIGSPFAGSLPSPDAIDRALEAFRGTFLQQPPAFSAKKIGGKRSHKLARAWRRSDPESDAQSDRQSDRALPAPASVTIHRLDVVGVEADRLTLTVDCSAGFYIRSLAHDLGQALGTGAHLERLRRTRSGEFTLAGAIELAAAEQDHDRARAAVIPLACMLPELRAVVLTFDGVRHAIQGRDLTPRDAISGFDGLRSGLVRLVDSTGALVGIAEAARTPGLLHPFVVLM